MATSTVKTVKEKKDVPAKSSISTAIIVKWIVSLAIPVGIACLPTSEALTSQIKIFLALTLWAVLVWAFELMDVMIPALALPVFYVVFNVAPIKVVFSSWANTVPWLVLGGMLLCKVFEDTGLMKRVAYWCIIKTGCSYRGIIIGLTLSGFVMATLIPTLAGRCALYAGLTYGLCKALDLTPKGNMATAIMLGGYFAATNTSFIISTGSNVEVMGLAALAEYGYPVSFGQFMLHHTIPAFIMALVMAWGLTIVLKPEKKLQGKEYFKEQYEQLGKVSSREKKVGIILLILVGLLVTNSIHGVEPAWIFLLGALICFVPLFNIAETSLVSKVNYPMIIFISATLSIGMVSKEIGASNLIATILEPVLTAGGANYTVIAVFFSGIVANFILTPLAAIASLVDPMIQIGLSLDMNPTALVYVFVQGLEQLLFPYEIAPALMTFAYGMIAMNKFMKVFAVKMVVTLVCIFVLFIPYWNFVGLL